MISDDYIKFVLEPYDFCPYNFCNLYGLKFAEIIISEQSVSLMSECQFCGETVIERLQHSDIIFHAKMFLKGQEINNTFRRFRIGLYYPELIYKGKTQPYYNLFLKMLVELRKTIIEKHGRKIKLPKDLGSNIETFIKRQQKKLKS